MDVSQAIESRRAYRSLEHFEITEEYIKDLAKAVQLTPSCFNNQPWRFVFCYDPPILEKVKAEALSSGNAWAHNASMIIGVFSKKEDDCIIKEREYFLFDTGMATAFLILQATELGLVCHPIAGYNPEVAKKLWNIPEEMSLITLLIVGRKSQKIDPILSEKQIASEHKRPTRLPINSIVFRNQYSE